jgi:hypothetical protein
MADHSIWRKIEVRVWSDEKFRALSPLPPSGQSLWFYLLTGPHTGPIPGLLKSGRAAMAEELGWSQEAFDKAFYEVFSLGMAIADWQARLVWIPNAIKCNLPQSPNVITSWTSPWQLLPECQLKQVARDGLKSTICGLGESFMKAFEKACPKPCGMPSPNQEQEQEQERPSSAGAEADPRHSLIRDEICKLWLAANCEIPTAPWDGREGKLLEGFLKANRSWALEVCLGCVRNRFASEANHSERPSRWIADLSSYASSPLDRFRRPLSMPGLSKTQSRIQQNRGKLSDAQFVGSGPTFPPCRFGECDGSKWFIERTTRQPTECRCARETGAADPILTSVISSP